MSEQDTNNVTHLISLVYTYRHRLAILVRQYEQLGAEYVPPHVESEIDSIRQTIADYKVQIARLRYPIEDQLLDFAPPVDVATPDPVGVWQKRVEWKLDQILELLREERI